MNLIRSGNFPLFPRIIRRRARVTVACTLIVALFLASTYAQADQADRYPQTFSVSQTYNQKPFDYRIESREEKADMLVYRLTYPSPVVSPVKQNNTIPAEYYVPKGIKPNEGRRPAVICLHILNGNYELERMCCTMLASHGVPAIMFKLPYYGERALPGGRKAMAANPELFAGALTQGVEDVRRTVDLLASRPEVNPQRIGVTGISLGGILAGTVAGQEPRLWRAMLILAGGDVMEIIRQAPEARPLKAVLESLPAPQKTAVETALGQVDPLRHAPGLRDRAQQQRVLMVNAADDHVIPRACTERLATALGIADRIDWLEGLGHYTAMAAFPEILKTSVNFFGQDLPQELKTQPATQPSAQRTPARSVISLLQDIAAFGTTEPAPGRCHLADLQVMATLKDGKPILGRLEFVRGAQNRFRLKVDVPLVGRVSIGQSSYPWIAAGQKALFRGESGREPGNPLAFVSDKNLVKLRVVAGALAGISLAPDMLDQVVTVADDTRDGGTPAVRVTLKDKHQGSLRLVQKADGRTPLALEFDIDGARGRILFRARQINAVAHEALFDAPTGMSEKTVDGTDLVRVFSAVANFGLERIEGERRVAGSKELKIVARDPAGHGLLCQSQGKTILLVSGTPEQMGTAHGVLLREKALKLMDRVLYVVGGAETIRSGTWFLDRMEEIHRRTTPHIPPRFLAECDAMSKAIGVSERVGRYGNLFPERFHCSGVAGRGKASAGGKVLHARVLDYMRDIDPQTAAAVVVFRPEGHNAWMSLGYAGFAGTVTAMNEKGLAIGEMGGRGEGDWDGMPMSFLLRDVMERASTVEEALEILRTTPRTCEYYYVVSDKSRAMAAVQATPGELKVLRPGQQDPRLPRVPEDTVMISGPGRAEALSRRLLENFGKIDVPTMIEIIKRPVSMESNLHDAVMAPETLDMWCADAGRHTPACDEPYVRCNLAELMRFYRQSLRP